MSLGSQPESLSHRQKSIVDWVQKNGYASIERMAEQFDVSAQTIRRDVIELSERRILQRHHGGASLPAGFDSLDYNIRCLKFVIQYSILILLTFRHPAHSIFCHCGNGEAGVHS